MTIKLDTSQYIAPSQEEVNAAKAFVERRDQFAVLLQERIDEILAETAQRIVETCYRYGIEPKTFRISNDYNEDMMSEIADIMEETEQRIIDLIYEYSTRVTDDRDRISVLAAWMALLGKGNRNLQDTLHGYMYKTLRDWEAAIAAMGAAGLTSAQAITRIKTYLHQIYNMPEVKEAFKHWQDFQAMYIRSRGIQYGAVGISNNGSTNVVNMGRYTLQLTWKHNLELDFEEEDGIGGFIVERGSTYNCSFCDSYVGFHKMDELDALPLFHPHCQCIAIPVYNKND